MNDRDTGIHVTGTGRATAPPDVMVLDAGVEVSATDPGTAFEQAKTAMAGLRDAILARGIEAKDLQTSQVSLHPTHDRDGRVNGHQASLGLRIVVHDIAGSGAVIDAVTAGAGKHARLNGLRLDHSDPVALLTHARVLAVADARAKAQELADLTQRKVGRCVRVEEVGGAPRMMMARTMAAAEMAVDGGEVEQEVTVSTVWDFAD
jgi:uncharacterized protein YggE